MNLEDKNAMLVIDANQLKVTSRWALTPCDEPAALAIDRKHHRLFAGCGNRLLTVLNAKTGHVVTAQPVGEHVDAAAYNPSTQEILASAADGTLTIISQDDANHYHVTQTLSTPQRSKTLGLDEATNQLFVPSAQFGSAPAPSAENPKGRPPVLPGTFNILTFGR